MAYPKIDLPMYKPLKAISVELFLPNINLIPPNSITLIETNQRFIESYMVGLNHEFARKLLWREYPTDQRGQLLPPVLGRAQLHRHRGAQPERAEGEALRHPRAAPLAADSALGDHNNRASPGRQRRQAVLMIRGELLKKYPTAVIYAQRAAVDE